MFCFYLLIDVFSLSFYFLYRHSYFVLVNFKLYHTTIKYQIKHGYSSLSIRTFLPQKIKKKTADGGVLIYGVRSGYPPGLDLRYQDVPSKAAKLACQSAGKDSAGGWPAPNPRNTKTMKNMNSNSASPQQKQKQAIGINGKRRRERASRIWKAL